MKSLTDHPEATPEVLDAFYHNLYDPGFLYSADREFVKNCKTPSLVLAGNDEAHPRPISDELAKLLPECRSTSRSGRTARRWRPRRAR